MVSKEKILILTSGKVSKLDTFDVPFKASFDDINYSSEFGDIFVNDKSLKDFEIIYFRMVGKSLEVATLVAEFAVKNKIKIIDKIYENSLLMPLSLGKSIELKKLIDAGVSVPKTVFGDLKKLPYPFIVKSTNSQKGREVWLVRNEIEMGELRMKFQKGKFYFSQEFIPNAKRARLLVIGEKVIGGILRQTKWNKDGTKEVLNPIPSDMEKLALFATRSAGLDISGVDILINKMGEMFIIEANAAPSWKLINKYCGVLIENEIIKYIQNQV
ncbi:MAG: hypothetical protein AAB535_03370 [Patescibacteria group bacterium]